MTTAAELLKELENDPIYQAKKKAKEAKFNKLKEMYDEDEKPLLKELALFGYPLKSIWDFVNSENYYMDAEPILVKHLSRSYHPKTLSGIARSLAVPEFATNEELWSLLVSLYKKTPSNNNIDIPEERGLQESIAIALEALYLPHRKESIEDIIYTLPDGDGINYLTHLIEE